MSLFRLVWNVVEKRFDIAEYTGLNQASVYISWHENGITGLSNCQEGCLQQSCGSVNAIPAVVSPHGGRRVPLTFAYSPLRFEWSTNLS
jgi:hypothetical protein